ncbi:unnamed protein product [Ambrosiozyma monospora]|uniref:Unnamed protein product n=2 Tax=Ambrosiozyma monospora TaxID=43982 RepID=A0ACB5U0Z3_AMBMO|nr:unnamed protein product [Ambrosiozyma monospora]
MKVINSWDANSDQCLMKTYFYNKINPEFANFERPADVSAEDWEAAMKGRPKGYNTIPVKAKGFEELFTRSNTQVEHVKQSRLLLNEINDKLVKLSDKHDLDSSSRLLQCRLRQKQLNLKLLRIAINLSILNYKGYQLTNDEEKLVSKFHELLNKIDDPIGLNRANELWARLSNLKQRLGNMSSNQAQLAELVSSHDSSNGDGPNNKNEAVIKKLVGILAKQQQGIQYLYELMEGDKEALAKLAKELS